MGVGGRRNFATADIGLAGPSGFARAQADVRPIALLADDGEKHIRPHLHDPDASGLGAQREKVVAIRIEVDRVGIRLPITRRGRRRIEDNRRSVVRRNRLVHGRIGCGTRQAKDQGLSVVVDRPRIETT